MNDIEFQRLLEAEVAFQQAFSAWVEEIQTNGNTKPVHKILRVDFSSTRVRVIFPEMEMVWMPFVLEACEKFSLKIEETCMYIENQELWLSFKR